MVMAATPRVSPESSPARPGTLTRRLAAVAGAAGAAAIGASDAQAVPYTPTAGIAAASGIPGFSFVDASNVTLGALRPPAGSGTWTVWDVDGNGRNDFNLVNSPTGRTITYGTLTTTLFKGAGIRGYTAGVRVSGGNNLKLLNLPTGGQVDSANAAWAGSNIVTESAGFFASEWSLNTAGQFGFRFTDNAANTYYGWGSLTIDTVGPSTVGQGFLITEAYYNTTPGAAISVGQVPQAVPEPSSMALLGLGAAGVAAWRARRKSQATAESQAQATVA